MSFITVTTLDGGSIVLAAETIFRVRPSLPVAETPNATKIEFGQDRQYTREKSADLAGRLTAAGIKLVALTSPNKKPVYLARNAISVIKPADPHQDPEEAKSVLIVAGKRQAVRETPNEVSALLDLG